MRPISFMRLASICGLTTKPLVDTCLVAADQVPVSSYQDASVGGLGGLFGGKEELTLLSLNIRYDNPLSAGGPSLPGPDLTNVPRLYQEYSWSSRRHAISDIILNSNPDIFFFQEVLHNQLQDLVYLLGEDYDWVGVGRDNGGTGEAVPVFWRKDKFQLLDEQHGGVGKKGVQHFWLSLTPDTPASKSWDAALTRMCTHVALRPLSPASTTTGSTAISPYAPIHIFSTHYDHKGVVARAESSKLIRSRAKEARDLSKSITGQEPLILLAGDLNSPREEQGWQNLVRGHHGISPDAAKQDLAEDLSFIDLQLAVPSRFGSPFNTTNFPQQRLNKRDSSSSSPLAGRAPLPPPPARPDVYQQKQHTPLFKAQTQQGRGILSSPFGPPSSFTDWKETRDRSTAEDRIDFIFLGDNQAQRGDEDPTSSISSSSSSSWKIKTAGVLSNWNRGDGGFRVSDHRPVIARLRWE